ncbi:hypothetical protein NC653_039317 [Populus alba x Populus x berolinensis]|uniref:Uncharacterized protein n=1 Tax=Populus alba x Populus x berolinensis TaxID=444605 RepID=A0AAD6PRZ1_9ROSI|nr:hypothetical protein NC653_039317 [Populus alba x Populus x berolinensis]
MVPSATDLPTQPIQIANNLPNRGQLLDDECPGDFIKGLILSVCSLLPVEPLVEECEKKNRLRLLTQFLEHLVSEGSQDVHVHNALGKISLLEIITHNTPSRFLHGM